MGPLNGTWHFPSFDSLYAKLARSEKLCESGANFSHDSKKMHADHKGRQSITSNSNVNLLRHRSCASGQWIHAKALASKDQRQHTSDDGTVLAASKFGVDCCCAGSLDSLQSRRGVVSAQELLRCVDFRPVCELSVWASETFPRGEESLCFCDVPSGKSRGLPIRSPAHGATDCRREVPLPRSGGGATLAALVSPPELTASWWIGGRKRVESLESVISHPTL